MIRRTYRQLGMITRAEFVNDCVLAAVSSFLGGWTALLLVR